MKKSLLALAVLGAFAGVAQAQTAVTIYGSFDAGVRYTTNVGTTTATSGDNKWTMGSNGTYNSNRIGFKGVEDLGGGLNAHFTLETGFNSGSGALDTATTTNKLFNRSAFVGLGGTWGSLDLGRQYSVNFQTIGAYDPFNYKFTGIIPLSAQGGLTRLDNDIKYTGTFGPVTARAEYALGEVAGSTSSGSTQAVGISYAGGPFSIGTAYTQRKNNQTTAAAALGGAAPDYRDQKNWTIGGAFATGPFRIAAGYADSKQENIGVGATDSRIKDAWLGGSYNFTPAAALTAAWYQTKTTAPATAVSAPANFDGKRDLFIVGMTYALSKRTNFYADIDTSRLNGNAAGSATLPVAATGNGTAPYGQTRQNGVSVGINHLF